MPRHPLLAWAAPFVVLVVPLLPVLKTAAAVPEQAAYDPAKGIDAELLKAKPRCVVFYKGDGFLPPHSGCCTMEGTVYPNCWSDDKARSLIFYGPGGSELTIYDSSCGTADDWLYVKKANNETPLTIHHFDNTKAHDGKVCDKLASGAYKWISGASDCIHRPKDGLAGKVSCYKWAQPK